MIWVLSAYLEFGIDDADKVSVDGSNLIVKGFRHENLYLVDFGSSEAKLSTCLFTKSSVSYGIEGWHMLE